MSALPKKSWTAEEYLAFERTSYVKHEFIGGEVYLLTGASRNHNLIVFNMVVALGNQLRGRPCEAYANDMRVKILTDDYVYPDMIVVCAQPQFEGPQVDTLLNPTVIIEVLSPSTEQYDRGKKFHNYRTIDSLQEYVLVSQDMARIERFRRQDNGQWLYSELTAPEGIVELESIDSKLMLAEVYDKVTFDAA